MTAQAHMEELAKRYADAMVQYHLGSTADTTDMAEIHGLLWQVAKEVAEEQQ